ncbi:MAG: ABC transporter permease [Clostridia bacterium]|nr:ABC transporter permease [Clostridia bacterium]
MSKNKKIKGPRTFYNPFYFLFDAIRNLWRHRATGFASVLVLTSCLILLGAFGLLIRNIDVNVQKLGLLNEIVVFVDYDTTPQELQIITEDIKALENVTYVDYISKDAGFESMKDTYPDYADLFDSISQSGDNPLADSFIVTYKDTAGANKLEYDLLQIEGVMKVNNRVDYAATIENFKSGLSFVFIWFFALLLAVSVFVIFNTIKLAVHGRRNEISIMRFIGATKAYIIAPFIIEGVAIGAVSAAIAYFADMGIYNYVLKNAGVGTSQIMNMFSLIPFSDMQVELLAIFMLLGIVTGVVASIVSLQKNLSN